MLRKYDAVERKVVVNSAMTIISANVAQGNALTGLNKNDEPIVFSEWKQLPNKRGAVWVQRTEYTLDAIINDGPSLDGQVQGHGIEELSLFDLDGGSDNDASLVYAPAKIVDVYKEKLVEL